MTFKELYNNVQNIGILNTFTDTTPSIILPSGQGNIFPISNGRVVVELWNASGKVIKREVVDYTTRTIDTLTSLTRSVEYCVQDDTQTTKTRTNNVLDFTPTSGQVVTVSMRQTEGNDQEVKERIIDLETNKANDANVVHKTGTETILAKKIFVVSPEVPDAINAKEPVSKQQMDSAIISSGSADSINDKTSFLTGQSVSVGDSLFPEVGPTLAQATAVEAIGNTSTFTRYSIPCISSGLGLSSIKLGLKKTGSPSVNLNIRIEGDNNGLPSGIQLDTNGIASINPSSLTTSIADTTILFAGSTVTNSHGVTLNVNETSQTLYKGFKYTLTTQTSFVNVTKVAGCTSTKCYLYDLSGNLLTSATFSSNVATLNYDGLVNGNSYYIATGSDGSSYTSVKQTGSTAYPYTLTKMNLISGFTRSNGATDTMPGTNYGQFAFQVTLTTIFTATKTCKLSSVSSGNNATLYDNATNTLIEASISNVFSGNTTLQAGTVYKITTTYPAYSTFYNVTAQTPVVRTNLTITSATYYTGSYGYISITTSPEITEDTNIYNIASISTTDNVIIPRGVKFHVVLYVGTYGSETLNSSNFYGISCMLQDTYTRYANIYNGTTWSGYITEFPYISSTAIENTLLSKTSASFQYKVPKDCVRISKENKGVGKNVVCTTYGINNSFSGLSSTPTEMYISNSPGLISATKGTVVCNIGYTVSSTSLFVREPMTLIQEAYIYNNTMYGNTNTAYNDATGSTGIALSSSQDANYALAKTVTANFKGRYNIGVTLTTNTGNFIQVSARIFKNGVLMNQQDSGYTSSTNKGTFTFLNFPVDAGDTIQLYLKVIQAQYSTNYELAGYNNFSFKFDNMYNTSLVS